MKKWVTDFMAKNKRMPTESDIAVIAADIIDYNFINQ
jgi:hypothetical protein